MSVFRVGPSRFPAASRGEWKAVCRGRAANDSLLPEKDTIILRSSSDQPLKTGLRNRLPLFSVLCQLIYSTHRRSPWFDVKRPHLMPLSLSAAVSLITTTH